MLLYLLFYFLFLFLFFFFRIFGLLFLLFYFLHSLFNHKLTSIDGLLLGFATVAFWRLNIDFATVRIGRLLFSIFISPSVVVWPLIDYRFSVFCFRQSVVVGRFMILFFLFFPFFVSRSMVYWASRRLG